MIFNRFRDVSCDKTWLIRSTIKSPLAIAWEDGNTYGLSYGDKDTLTDQRSEEGIKEEATVDVLELFNRRPIGEWQLEVIRLLICT